MTIFGGAHGAEYKLIDESKPSRTRTWEAEKSSKKAVTRAYACIDDCTIPAGRRAAGAPPQAALRTLHVTLDETTHEARATVLLERRGYVRAIWQKSFAHEAEGSVERGVGEGMERRHTARRRGVAEGSGAEARGGG